MIQADYIAHSKFSGNSDTSQFFEASTRQWYQLALLKGMGETVYSDIIEDAHGGGECIVCAQPVYLNGEIVAVAGVGSYLDKVDEVVLTTSIGENGYAFMVNQNGNVIISPKKHGDTANYEWKTIDLRDSKNKVLAELAEDMIAGGSGVERLILDDREVYLAYAPLKSLGWSFVTVMDVSEVIAPAVKLHQHILDIAAEVEKKQEIAIWNTLLYFVIIVALVAAMITFASMVFTGRLTMPIRRLTKEVVQINGGNLEARIQIRTGDELEELGNAFNHMTAQIQEYVNSLATVTAEKERIRTEIQVASRLQADMLPEAEGAFKERTEFSIYANMIPAKGVGGDFYDFFLLDEDHLALVMADSLSKAMEEVNSNLCDNNKNSMFVTAWIGVITISTGELTYVNAGHCRPIIRHRDGSCNYETLLSGFVVGGLEETTYRQYELRLQPGDFILLYTDGVTEATSAQNTLYGEEKLSQLVSGTGNLPPKELLERLWQDVDNFQKGAEQFDDITMLALHYYGGSFRVKTGEPKIENIQDFVDFVSNILTYYEISTKSAIKIKIAVDEIFSNICYYSGATEVTIKCGITKDGNLDDDVGYREVFLIFCDDGVPCNPLSHPKPDVKESLEKRKEGGLGIHMVKQQMDKVEYRYINDNNQLTLYKRD